MTRASRSSPVPMPARPRVRAVPRIGYCTRQADSPPRVIQLATLGAARIMHHDAERGSVAGGTRGLGARRRRSDSADQRHPPDVPVVKTGSSTARLSCTARWESGRRQPERFLLTRAFSRAPLDGPAQTAVGTSRIQIPQAFFVERARLGRSLVSSWHGVADVLAGAFRPRAAPAGAGRRSHAEAAVPPPRPSRRGGGRVGRAGDPSASRRSACEKLHAGQWVARPPASASNPAGGCGKGRGGGGARGRIFSSRPLDWGQGDRLGMAVCAATFCAQLFEN